MDEQKAAAIREFQEYLQRQVQLTGATVLAEEFSTDAMMISQATTSTAAQVAKRLGIKHLFCDPGQAERERLGIRTDQREGYWANQIERLNARRILFLCGDDHVVTFPAVLQQRGLQSSVLSEGWGMHLNPTRAGKR